jgi:hypothetical protein
VWRITDCREAGIFKAIEEQRKIVPRASRRRIADPVVVRCPKDFRLFDHP